MSYDQPKTKEEKIASFQELGFSDLKALEYLAEHFGSQETLKNKIELLENAGFQHPVTTIEKFPQLASYDIQRVVGALSDAGFQYPVTAIEKHPQLASFDIQQVVGALTDAGFEHPATTIEKLPSLAGLDIQRVKRRIALIEKTNKLFHCEYDAVNIIESSPVYLSYSRDRIFFFLRVAAQYHLTEKQYKPLIMVNPYLLFSRLFATPPSSADELMKISRSFAKMTKEQKKHAADEGRGSLDRILDSLRSRADTLMTDEEKHTNEFLIHLAVNLKRQESRKKTKKKQHESEEIE